MPYADSDSQREYQRQWIAKRRAEWLAANGPCVQCGSADRLEVDHIEPELKVHHRVWSWSKSRRDAELAKCQVLCHTCHLNKTIAWYREQWSSNDVEHDPGFKPGTGGYRRGCRCFQCCLAKAEYAAKYRAKSA